MNIVEQMVIYLQKQELDSPESLLVDALAAVLLHNEEIAEQALAKFLLLDEAQRNDLNWSSHFWRARAEVLGMSRQLACVSGRVHYLHEDYDIRVKFAEPKL